MAKKRKTKKEMRDANVFSLHFFPNMEQSGHKTFVTYEQYMKLEKKYYNLFARYQRERK